MDPYRILNVTQSASQDDIKRSYHSLAKTHHPDLKGKSAANEAVFKDINAAYDLLSNPEKRRKYDCGEIDGHGNEIYNPYRQQSSAKQSDSTAGFSFEEMFSSMFKSRRGNQNSQSKSQKRAKQEPDYTLRISFLDAQRGVRKKINLVNKKQGILTIPPGTKDKQILRLKSEGGIADVLVEIHVAPETVASNDDGKSYVEVPISLPEALLGAKIPVATYEGDVYIRIPPGGHNGKAIRLQGQGVLDPKTGKRGDLYVRLKIILPPEIDSELEDFMRDWELRNAYDVR